MIHRSKHFISLPLGSDDVIDFQDDHPTKVFSWKDRTVHFHCESQTFGFLFEGDAFLIDPSKNHYKLEPGQFFVTQGGKIVGGTGIACVRVGKNSLFQLGGPIEKMGRLRYIDGCSDTLLVPPTIRGDACLNHLHFPKNIEQTRHTHPTIRAGLVAKGRGRCVVPANDDGSGPDVSIPLVPGNFFVIPPGGHHSFFTDDETMDVIAYHPDSDTGPTHDDHPMINRTYVDGVSASGIEAIRTTVIAE